MRKLLILTATTVLVVLILQGCYPATDAGPAPQATIGSPPTAGPAPATPPPAGTEVPATAGPTPAGSAAPEPSAAPSESSVPAAILDAARAYLAQQSGVAAAGLLLLRAEEVEWRDSCLGAAGPREMCLQVITPGYRLVFRTPQGESEVHTDRTGRAVRLASGGGAAPPETGAPGSVTWERSGGIAGICRRLEITPEGDYTLTDCRAGRQMAQGRLPAQDAEHIAAQVSRSGTIIWQTPPPTGADQFVDRFSLAGTGEYTASEGSGRPPESELQAIDDYLGELVARLQQ